MYMQTTTNDNPIQYILQRVLYLVRTPILISLILTPIRFFLELSGLPENLIFLVGLLWLTLGFSIYWGFKLQGEKHAFLILLTTLTIFSPISRLPVALFWWIDTKFELGTHYGLYFDNLQQAVLNQVIYGSLIQIIPGFVIGSITYYVLLNRNSLKK